ncbi:MAG: class I SAM-dependent methyltransferase [Anaerolineales bacterium]|nr:class I SAM-dependent methyltransferase [Anaerolineales bacterium]
MVREYDFNVYWEDRAQRYLGEDRDGYAAVLYLGEPVWYNRFFACFQERALKDQLGNPCTDSPQRVLEIGCGTGRWAELLSRYGSYTGVDISPSLIKRVQLRLSFRHDFRRQYQLKYRFSLLLLGFSSKIEAKLPLQDKSDCTLIKRAIQLHPMFNFFCMSATQLAFPSLSFDRVVTVTVLQHLPFPFQELAIGEICRVTKSEGMIHCLELIYERNAAPHVYPNTLAEWCDKFRAYSCHLISAKGQEYAPLIRLERGWYHRLMGKRGFRHYRSVRPPLLKVLLSISYPLEHFLSRLLPTQFARHVVATYVKE